MKLRLLAKKLHLYLAILSCIPLLIAGLTGAVLVYQTPLDTWLNRNMMVVNPGSTWLSYDLLYQKVQTAYPKVNFRGMSIPEQKDRAFEFWDDGDDNWTVYYVDPYQGTITGNRTWNDWTWRNIIWILTDLHYSLKAGQPGRYVIGVAAIILTFSAMTGLYLWAPRSLKNVKSKLQLKVFRRRKQTSYVWHGNLGFYFSLVVVLIALTGASMTFYDASRSLIHWMTLSPPPKEDPKLARVDGRNMLSLDELFVRSQIHIETVHGRRPWPMQFNFPDKESAAVRTRFQEVEHLYGVTRYNIWMNPYTGEVIQESSPPNFNRGEVILGWVGALHFGTWGDYFHPMLGGLTRIIWVFGALMPCFLTVTGFILWKKPAVFKRASRSILAARNP